MKPGNGANRSPSCFPSRARAGRDPRRFEALEQTGRIGDPVLYFLSGSMNLNVRSMALDGEVHALVAGPWALQAYLNFALLSGGVTWVERLEELDALLPSYSRRQRWIGRYLQCLL